MSFRKHSVRGAVKPFAVFFTLALLIVSVLTWTWYSTHITNQKSMLPDTSQVAGLTSEESSTDITFEPIETDFETLEFNPEPMAITPVNDITVTTRVFLDATNGSKDLTAALPLSTTELTGKRIDVNATYPAKHLIYKYRITNNTSVNQAARVYGYFPQGIRTKDSLSNCYGTYRGLGWRNILCTVQLAPKQTVERIVRVALLASDLPNDGKPLVHEVYATTTSSAQGLLETRFTYNNLTYTKINPNLGVIRQPKISFINWYPAMYGEYPATTYPTKEGAKYGGYLLVPLPGLNTYDFQIIAGNGDRIKDFMVNGIGPSPTEPGFPYARHIQTQLRGGKLAIIGFEWYNAGFPMTLRLQWKKPGATEYEDIPTTSLFSGSPTLLKHYASSALSVNPLNGPLGASCGLDLTAYKDIDGNGVRSLTEKSFAGQAGRKYYLYRGDNTYVYPAQYLTIQERPINLLTPTPISTSAYALNPVKFTGLICGEKYSLKEIVPATNPYRVTGNGGILATPVLTEIAKNTNTHTLLQKQGDCNGFIDLVRYPNKGAYPGVCFGKY